MIIFFYGRTILIFLVRSDQIGLYELHSQSPFLGQGKMNVTRKKYHWGYRAVGMPDVHLDFPSHFSSEYEERLTCRGCYFALSDIDILGRNILLCVSESL